MSSKARVGTVLENTLRPARHDARLAPSIGGLPPEIPSGQSTNRAADHRVGGLCESRPYDEAARTPARPAYGRLAFASGDGGGAVVAGEEFVDEGVGFGFGATGAAVLRQRRVHLRGDVGDVGGGAEVRGQTKGGSPQFL